MLRIYDVALRALRELRPFLDGLERRDADLSRQGRRAGASVTLNIAEGSAFVGRREKAHYRIALGSAKELRAVIDSAEALGYVALAPRGRDDLEHVIAALIKLTR